MGLIGLPKKCWLPYTSPQKMGMIKSEQINEEVEVGAAGPKSLPSLAPELDSALRKTPGPAPGTPCPVPSHSLCEQISYHGVEYESLC